MDNPRHNETEGTRPVEDPVIDQNATPSTSTMAVSDDNFELFFQQEYNLAAEMFPDFASEFPQLRAENPETILYDLLQEYGEYEVPEEFRSMDDLITLDALQNLTSVGAQEASQQPSNTVDNNHDDDDVAAGTSSVVQKRKMVRTPENTKRFVEDGGGASNIGRYPIIISRISTSSKDSDDIFEDEVVHGKVVASQEKTSNRRFVVSSGDSDSSDVFDEDIEISYDGPRKNESGDPNETTAERLMRFYKQRRIDSNTKNCWFLHPKPGVIIDTPTAKSFKELFGKDVAEVRRASLNRKILIPENSFCTNLKAALRNPTIGDDANQDQRAIICEEIARVSQEVMEKGARRTLNTPTSTSSSSSSSPSIIWAQEEVKSKQPDGVSRYHVVFQNEIIRNNNTEKLNTGIIQLKEMCKEKTQTFKFNNCLKELIASSVDIFDVDGKNVRKETSLVIKGEADLFSVRDVALASTSNDIEYIDAEDCPIISDAENYKTENKDTEMSNSIACKKLLHLDDLISSLAESASLHYFYGKVNGVVPSKSNLRKDFQGKKNAIEKKKLNLKFTNVTIFYFERSQGFCSIPSKGGTTLGMTCHHFYITTLPIHEYEIKKTHKEIPTRRPNKMIYRRHDSKERIKNIEALSIGERIHLLESSEITIEICEEEECAQIRSSRASAGCDCKEYCDPEICSCSISSIECQVDRPNFPCGCTKENCKNVMGRIEYNQNKVKTHFIKTMKKMRLENKARYSKRKQPAPAKVLTNSPEVSSDTKIT